MFFKSKAYYYYYIVSFSLGQHGGTVISAVASQEVL